MSARQIESRERRQAAAEVAAARPPVVHRSNGDEQRLRGADGRPTYAASFTKCLPHDEHGFLQAPSDYTEWVRSIGSGDPRDFRRIRLGPGPLQPNGDFEYTPAGVPKFTWAASYPPAVGEPGVRAWESQGAGLTFELEGPDAQSVTMPPCPSIDSQELIAEMAEVYWMALCRDRPFAGASSARTAPPRCRSRRCSEA
jgi:hypothetical protein